jgi:hypothetical protein
MCSGADGNILSRFFGLDHPVVELAQGLELPICKPRDASLVTSPADCLADAGYTGMKTRKLGTIFALLAAMPWLIGCETTATSTSTSSDGLSPQFQKQAARAQECRQLQDKLVGDQPITPERAAEITKAMNPTGCAARLPGYY